MVNTRDIATLPSETIEKLLQAIPFYKSVKQHSEEEYQELLRYSRIFHFGPGERILSRGQVDNWSYFLLKGQLAVTVTNAHGSQVHLNNITPGEVFGDMSVLLKTPRTADVTVAEESREAVVFGTDFSLFGQLSNFRIISLDTKLIYYRHMVQSFRWKLEVYRSQYREHELANKHREVKLYTGPKGGRDELYALYLQARAFAKLLMEWNDNFGTIKWQQQSLESTLVG